LFRKFLQHSTRVWCSFQAFLPQFTLTDTILAFAQMGPAGKASKAIFCACTSLTSVLPVITLNSPHLLIRLSL